MSSEERLRKEVIEICRRIQQKGFIAASDGNVSCRLDGNAILITPGGRPKGELEAEDLLRVDMQGRVVEGRGKPSSEIRMHLCVYGVRSDVEAVVHAHPPMLTAFTVAGMPFVSGALPEVWLTIGSVPTAPYATPSTVEVPASIEPFLENHHAILLERHGSLTFGKDIREAYMRLEKLEHAAHTLCYAHLLAGRAMGPLPESDLKKLDSLRG